MNNGFPQLIRKLNAALLRSADIKLSEKESVSVSFGDLLGRLNVGGFFILIISFGTILLVASIIGANFHYEPFPIIIYLVAGIPALLAGFVAWILLFRLKKWLKV